MERKGTIYLVLASCLMGLVFSVGFAWADSDELKVMTRNLYLGADLTPAMAAQNEGEFVSAVSGILETIARNNFSERAEVLAAEIVDKTPHLVGLQEVYNFTFNGSNGAPPFRDYLADLQAALKAQGAEYRVAAVVNNLNLQLPFGGNLVGVLDRDVILARMDVATEVINFGDVFRKSGDGFNYQVVASIPNPLGAVFPPITIERGFVGVTAQLPDDSNTDFVTTHLEVREVGPFGLLQALQAQELVSALGRLSNPVILVGDFNSDPRDPVQNAIVPPYTQLMGAGYVDAWLEQRRGHSEGFTCCQEENLFNVESVLYERVDLILSSEQPRKVKVHLLGNKVTDKTATSGLWPSDHAGLSARLTMKMSKPTSQRHSRGGEKYHRH